MLAIEMETEQTSSTKQTPNTFERGLLKRLRYANETKATGVNDNNADDRNRYCIMTLCMQGGKLMHFVSTVT